MATARRRVHGSYAPIDDEERAIRARELAHGAMMTAAAEGKTYDEQARLYSLAFAQFMQPGVLENLYRCEEFDHYLGGGDDGNRGVTAPAETRRADPVAPPAGAPRSRG